VTTVTSSPAVVHSLWTRLRMFTERRMLRAVEWYQRERAGALSPCRFFPSCSEYAHDAVTTHGPWRGGWLTLRRLGRCRPFGPSGYDPVPGHEADCEHEFDCGHRRV
jgi:putative membrane protein insertion efficiency factor